MVGLGTVFNVVAVALGTGLGVLLGGRLPERVRTLVMTMLGLFTVVMGITDGLDTFGDVLSGALGQAAVIVVLGSLILGGIVGELAGIDQRLEQFGGWLRKQVASSSERGTFVEGFVIASMVFCVGPLAILGPMQDGLAGNYQLLMVKSMLDGFASLAFASVFGVGVGFAIIPLVAIQGGVTLLAAQLDTVLTEPMVAGLGALGGFLVLAIGLRLLEVRPIPVANLLPGLLIVPIVIGLLT